MAKHKIALLGLSMLMAAGSMAQQSTSPEVEKSLSIFGDVMRNLDMYYVDTLNYQSLTETAIQAMLYHIDPWTNYFPEEKHDQYKSFMYSTFSGVGTTIMQRDSFIYINSPMEGKPIQRNGLRAGDKILEVDGTKCYGKSTRDVSNLLRGNAGTTVTITVEREGVAKPITVSFKREEITSDPVPYIAMLTDRIGYIEFSEFSNHSAQNMRAAIDSLAKQGCKELIIDLRGNGGGSVQEAVTIAGLFVPKGTEIITSKGRYISENHNYKTIAEPLYPNMPLTILVDDQSASASELTSGALQDLGRATLVGDTTFGKGVMQNVRSVSHNGNLKITIARYYLPSGRCIHKKGVIPDILVPDDDLKVNICYALYNKNLFFDYATRYRNAHDSIAPLDIKLYSELYPKPESADNYFHLDSTDLVDFENFLKEKNFKYETETAKYFDELLKFADKEDLDDTMVAELKEMRSHLDTDYHDALWRHKDMVLNFLEREIAERYYYDHGATTIYLRNSKVLLRAIEEIQKTYNK